VYFMCREWSREYFVELYQSLQVSEFEKYYPESSTESRGAEEVRSRIGSVFKESDGAVIFEGEVYGLHTRVFITREQLPTYEAKDLGLILMQMEEFAFDHRILITGREQSEYMKVVWKATDQVLPGIEAKMTHLTNGLIKFGDGQKMSSRAGNVTTAVDVLAAVRSAVGDSGDPERDEGIYLGAVKYEFLKHRLGGDIAFDPQDSVSLQGNSGPYLQYALVRARSILTKSDGNPTLPDNLEPDERNLVRKLAEYQLVLEASTRNFESHSLCSYLYDLAVEFNKFYEKSRIIGDQREAQRLKIVSMYATTLEEGLALLGIYAPEKM
jgi:arginyl-tRNA synthetase